MRVLLVEDDAKLARAVARGLRHEGYAVDVATDGDEALADAAVWEYDAIVLDVMLPRRDGIEVCAGLRERGCWAPVLMVTTRGEIPDRVRGLDAGADDYLVKPFALEELLARVRALLRRSPAAASEVLRFADLELDPAMHEASRGSASWKSASGAKTFAR